MTAGTTNFPGSLDSHTGASPLGMGEVNNQAYTKTTASHTNSVTTITVASTTLFPSKGYIVVKREIISYTGTTATTFTGCTRGTGGTTAAAFASGTLVEQVPVAANHNDLAAAIVAIETKLGTGSVIGSNVPLRNRVINGDFRVQQRTTLGTTDDSYILDQWTLLLEAASAAAASQETSDVPTDGSNRALKLTVGSGEDNKFGVVNIIEYLDSSDLRGKQVSLQAKLKATAAITDVRMAVLEWTSTADSVTSDVVATWGSAGTNPTLATNWAYIGTPANLSVTTSWATYKVENISVGASTNNLAVFIWCEDESTTVTTDILRITDVQLEEGTACMAIERRHLQVERLLCRRYLRSYGGGTFETIAIGTQTANNAGLFGLMHDSSPMRAAQTLTYTAFSDWSIVGYTGGGATTITSFTAYAGGPGAHFFRGGVAGTPFTPGTLCLLQANNTSARIYLSAEL